MASKRRNHERNSIFKLLPTYQKGDLHVLDVREQEEYDALHLDGVHLPPLSELADRYQELEKDHPIMSSASQVDVQHVLANFWKSKAMM